MTIINRGSYIVKPSDSRDWVIIESPEGLAIDVELRLMDYHYDCIPQKITQNGQEVNCSQLCCYTGCYVTKAEIEEANRILPKIKQNLQTDARKLLKKTNNEIYLPEDYDDVEKLYKTRCAPEDWEYKSDTDDDEKESEEEGGKESNDFEEDNDYPPKNHCIFLMENGYCATHKYYLDNKIAWVKQKFNICTTFPIDIRPQDKTLAFMEDFDNFTFGDVNCISSDEEHKIKLGMPQVIESMKYVIVDRYGEQWWKSLNLFAKDYRNKKITIEEIYQGTQIDEEEKEK
jgi:hypothetical protein